MPQDANQRTWGQYAQETYNGFTYDAVTGYCDATAREWYNTIVYGWGPFWQNNFAAVAYTTDVIAEHHLEEGSWSKWGVGLASTIAAGASAASLVIGYGTDKRTPAATAGKPPAEKGDSPLTVAYREHTEAELRRKLFVGGREDETKPRMTICYVADSGTGADIARGYAEKHLRGKKTATPEQKEAACYDFVAHLDAGSAGTMERSRGELAKALGVPYSLSGQREAAERDAPARADADERIAFSQSSHIRAALRKRGDVLLCVHRYTPEMQNAVGDLIPDSCEPEKHLHILVTAPCAVAEGAGMRIDGEREKAVSQSLRDTPALLRHLPAYYISRQQAHGVLANRLDSQPLPPPAPQVMQREAAVEELQQAQHAGEAAENEIQPAERRQAPVPQDGGERRGEAPVQGIRARDSLITVLGAGAKPKEGEKGYCGCDLPALEASVTQMCRAGLTVGDYAALLQEKSISKADYREVHKKQTRSIEPALENERIFAEKILRNENVQEEDVPDLQALKRATEIARVTGYGNEDMEDENGKRVSAPEAGIRRDNLRGALVNGAKRCPTSKAAAYYLDAEADLQHGTFYMLPDNAGFYRVWRDRRVFPESGPGGYRCTHDIAAEVKAALEQRDFIENIRDARKNIREAQWSDTENGGRETIVNAYLQMARAHNLSTAYSYAGFAHTLEKKADTVHQARKDLQTSTELQYAILETKDKMHCAVAKRLPSSRAGVNMRCILDNVLCGLLLEQSPPGYPESEQTAAGQKASEETVLTPMGTAQEADKLANFARKGMLHAFGAYDVLLTKIKETEERERAQPDGDEQHDRIGGHIPHPQSVTAVRKYMYRDGIKSQLNRAEQHAAEAEFNQSARKRAVYYSNDYWLKRLTFPGQKLEPAEGSHAEHIIGIEVEAANPLTAEGIRQRAAARSRPVQQEAQVFPGV